MITKPVPSANAPYTVTAIVSYNTGAMGTRKSVRNLQLNLSTSVTVILLDCRTKMEASNEAIKHS